MDKGSLSDYSGIVFSTQHFGEPNFFCLMKFFSYWVFSKTVNRVIIKLTGSVIGGETDES